MRSRFLWRFHRIHNRNIKIINLTTTKTEVCEPFKELVFCKSLVSIYKKQNKNNCYLVGCKRIRKWQWFWLVTHQPAKLCSAAAAAGECTQSVERTSRSDTAGIQKCSWELLWRHVVHTGDTVENTNFCNIATNVSNGLKYEVLIYDFISTKFLGGKPEEDIIDGFLFVTIRSFEEFEKVWH